ncbi:MAG: hypothetical protein LBH98_07925 [Chitinispirillales bacterium]|jgi:hypothetical protein|nr:hypothetical protein [Chitinispirillales bacterium]
MKKISILFTTAFCLFAQENDALRIDSVSAHADSVLQSPQEITENEISDEIFLEEIDSAAFENPFVIEDAFTVEKNDAKIHKIVFVGIQSGEIPELRDTFEEMVRTHLGREINAEFIPKEFSMRVCRKLFLNNKIVIDSVFFEELKKHELQNTIVLLIDVEEYRVAAVRRAIFGAGAGIEGKLKANYLFYDANTQKELFFARASSVSTIKKGLVFWHSLESRVNISSDDIKKINADLLKNVVAQGFDMLEIAVSLRK